MLASELPEHPGSLSVSSHPQLAEELGFATVLLAEHTFNWVDPELDQQDAWTTSAALASITKDIELMPAVRPAFKHPAVVAKMACSIDEISGGRAALNLVTGWWQREWEAMGLPPMPHDDRYVRSEEFLTDCGRSSILVLKGAIIRSTILP